MTDGLPPFDGPYSPEATAQAADLAASAIRYLCNATRHPEALPDPGDVYRVLGALQEVPGGLPQVCGQLASRLEAMAAAGTLRDSDGDDPAALVHRAARELAYAARAAADVTAACQEAQDSIAGLSVKDESTGREKAGG